MSKYIDADKLLAEIEQKISICEKQRSDAIEVECYNLADHASARIGELHVIQETIASLQQEQPEVDFENYLENYFKGWHIEEEIGLTKPDGWSCIVDDLKSIARHFAEWGAIHLNTRKGQPKVDLENAARHVYESWKGGTMDDVRRDMVELGRVLNARKEE